MRGYTSLFSHILGSHPEIKGYSEMHQSYKSMLGLLKLRYKSKLTTKSSEVPRFLYDKLLHNNYKISKTILRKRNVHPIIMIRDPESTLKSIINMGEKMTKVVSWYKEEDKVAEYYEDRLSILEKIARQANGKAIFIKGDQMIDQTDETLAFLTTTLKLKTPLSKEYDTFSFTGTVGMGDPSDHIKSGTIKKQRDKYEEIEISPEILKRLNELYEEKTSVLNSLCRHIDQ